MAATRVPPSRDRDWWVDLATRALFALMQQRGAVVWPEVEAVLSESPWLRTDFDPSLPLSFRLDRIHLSTARGRLIRRGVIRTETVSLGGRAIPSYIFRPSLSYGARTATLRAAAAKRRLYRRFLTWAGDSRLCGSVAEHLVEAAMRRQAGLSLMVPRGVRFGRVTAMVGRPITVGGSLDGLGYWPTDPTNPVRQIPFAVEVKNLRDSVYPWDNELWDLLAKVAAFPEVVPVLVARRIHPISYRMFRDIGAIGTNLDRQVFSDSIDEDEFRRVCSGLSFHNAARVNAATIEPGLEKFFAETGPRIVERSLARWAVAAPIAARVERLRRTDLPGHERRDLWRQFGAETMAAGLYTGGWARRLVPSTSDEWDEADGGEEDWADLDGDDESPI